MRVVVDPLHHFSQAFTDSFKDGVLCNQDRFLGNIGNANALLQMQVPVVRALHACKNLEQGRLARAVATNQADPLGRLQGEVGVIEECDVAKSQGRVQ